jgi:D-alanyl-D-alanine carboxypeptidase
MIPLAKLCGFLVLCTQCMGAIADDALNTAAKRYLEPYVASNNFSGVVLIAQDGQIIHEKAYGFAAPLRRNTVLTQFHVASLSMQFTAAAIMRLVEAGKLKLDAPIEQWVSGLPNGNTITIRNLLEETSGLPDINALPEYSDILKKHQTATTLVEYIKGQPPRFAPGSAFHGEEHSAYNVLALIVEAVMKQPFSVAVRRLVFAPLHMSGSGIDDDSKSSPKAATGYSPSGVRDLEGAPRIHWSAKTGNGSAYATAGDILKWRNAFFEDKLLSTESRQGMLDYSHSRIGYGWFKNVSPRFGVPVFYMNGRAPGFASFLIEIPSAGLTVIVLGNTYISVADTIGLDLAAAAVGRPYAPTPLRASALPATDTSDIVNRYHFDADFYQPDATLILDICAGDASLRWPSGDITFLIPIARDHFIDRSYWEPVSIHRSEEGRVESLIYDRFVGRRL